MRWFECLTLCTAALFALGGCVQERVTGARGGLYGVPAAQGGVIDGSSAGVSTGVTVESVLQQYRPADPTLEPIEGETLRYRNPAGDIVLESRSPQQLIFHLSETLTREEHDLIYEQLISEEAKFRYRERFRDPLESVEFLSDRKDDVISFLLLMPGGETTPGIRMESIGGGALRLVPEVGGRYTGARFVALEVIIESGRCTLRSIYRKQSS